MTPSRPKAVLAALVALLAGCATDERDRFLCEGPERTCTERDSDGNLYVCWDDHCWPRAELPDAGDDAGHDGGDGGDDGGVDAGPDLVELLDVGPSYAMVDLGPRCRRSGALVLCVENPASAGEQLTAIDGLAGNDVWVVGQGNLILQWNGATWRRTEPSDGLQGALSDVDVTDAGIHVSGKQRRLSVWDAGNGGDGGWEWLSTGVNAAGDITSISLQGSTLFMAGDYSEVAVLDTTTGATATNNGSEALEPIYRLWADSPSSAWAITDGGIGRVRKDGGGVEVAWTAYSEDFVAIDGTAPDHAYAVGPAGAFFERGSTTWTNKNPIVNAPDFNAVWASATGGWATASDTQRAFDLSTFVGGVSQGVPYPAAQGQFVRALWGTPGAGELWGAGDKGLLVRRVGAGDFLRAPGSATPQLHAIAEGPGRRLFAVGDEQTVLMRRGTTWVPLLPQQAGAENDLHDLSSTADGLWVAGTGLRRLTWSADAGVATLGTASDGARVYYAIADTADAPLFAVGRGGAFARYTAANTWTPAGSPFGTVDMNAAQRSPDGTSLWIAGAGRVFEALDGGASFVDRTANLPTEVLYEDLWVQSASSVFVAGALPDGGASQVFHFDGGEWTGADVGARVTALVGRGSQVWAAAGGRVFEWTGSSWSELGQLSGFKLGAAFSSSAGVWFAGTDGVVARLDAGQ